MQRTLKGESVGAGVRNGCSCLRNMVPYSLHMFSVCFCRASGGLPVCVGTAVAVGAFGASGLTHGSSRSF